MAEINNDIQADLDELVTWQYDNAAHLTGIIDLLKDFAAKGVEEPFNKILSYADLLDVDDDYSLGVWGRLLGCPRPIISPQSGIWKPLSAEVYRKLLACRYRLLCRNASIDDYVEFASEVFDGNVSFKDNFDMTVEFAWTTGTPTDYNGKELKSLFDLFMPDIVYPLPAGVRVNGTEATVRFFTCTPSNTTKQDSAITNCNPNEGGCLSRGN